MNTFCKMHIHDWVSRPATHRRDRLVRKCRRCGKVKVIRLERPVAPEITTREKREPRGTGPAQYRPDYRR